MLTVGLTCAVLGVLGLATVLADLPPHAIPAVKDDPRCFVAATPLREVQTRTIDEALAILREDLSAAAPGQAGMLLIRGCR